MNEDKVHWMSFRVSKALQRDIKKIAVEYDISVQELITNILITYLQGQKNA